MPVTGSIDQETPTQETVEQAGSVAGGHAAERLSLSEQTSDTSGAEVSSTTVDSDPVSETGLALALHSEQSDHVQSTSVDASSDSLDEFKDKIAAADDPASGASSSVSSAGSRGFQDAFAAFASASYRQAEGQSSVDVCNNVSDTTFERQEAAVSTALDSVNVSGLDSLVSSAIDSGQVTTTGESLVRSGEDVEPTQPFNTDDDQHQIEPLPEPDPSNQSTHGAEQTPIGDETVPTQYSDSQPPEAGPSSDSVYFIQTTDASGQVVTSIIDPNDIPSYTNSVVYKQCMRSDGEIETTIVYSDGVAVAQEQPEEQPPEQPAAVSEEADSQEEQQIIYAHDLNGHLTPIDSAQSFNDVAPPGKQFVYMQDSSGRIIRTIMDANQTMVPGQQVYYTQSEDGRIITSVMDPATAGVTEEPASGQPSQEAFDQMYQPQQVDEAGVAAQPPETSSAMVGSSNFNIDNSMSGLSMLAELSHLTSGQGLTTEQITASSTDSSSMDQDDFRPIAMVTRQTAGDEGLESVSSEIAELKVGEADSDSLDHSPSLLEGDGTGQEETLVTKFVSEMKEEQMQSCTVSRDNLFVQWQNLDAMCWMDVVLIMLVNSPSLRLLVSLDPAHELASTLLITLLKANRQAQIILQNILKKSSGAEISSLQTGAGNSVSIQDPKTSKLVCKENMDEIGKAINILYAMREKIWQALQPRLRCERGKHNSPVLVLPLLVREKPVIKQMFTMNYRYVFKCKQCGYSQDDSHTKILPSIPAVPEDFTMQSPCFVRNCFECQAPNQRMLMKFELLHDFVQMHFVKGLPHSRFDELSFDFNDDHYEVTAVVHYKNNPDHFIAWVRNSPGPAWMECDDLKSVITCYSNVAPNIPPSQVHMVMWERRLTPQHTLVMRDTEDTKLLASLVLTVQQPTSHTSTTQQSAEQVARPTGVPSTPGSAAGSPVTTAAQSTNTQTGLSNQSFSSYTPRARGRGRGSRGSFSSRGQAVSTSTPVIRRVTPTVTQLLSPAVSSSSHTSPQVIRLPLSALAGAGLGQRGSTGGTKYVLVGNNSLTGTTAGATSTRTNPASKVVVVRSQGGAASISATQLLQLLQRTGAISQPGTRITTTVTTSGAHSDGAPAPSTTSYIIQQDGSIVAAPANADVSGRQTPSEKTTSSQTLTGTSLMASRHEQGGESNIETDSVDTQHHELTKSSGPVQHTISTLPYLGATSALSQGDDTATQSVALPAEGSGSTEASGDAQVASGQAATSTQSQQPSRYIQVPNPAGGGHLLCQLVMRDGKMVLVPVDKSIQTQVSGTSVLKLSMPPSPKITIRVPTTSSQASASTGAFSQLQQQLLQTQSSSGASAGTRIITLPGAGGNKKIQLITVPRGVSTTQTNQQGTKTIIMSAASAQPTSVTTTSSIVTRLVSPGDGATSDSRILSQSGNVVIRELKQIDGDSVATMSPTDVAGHSSTGHMASTQTVSAFRDVAARPGTGSMGTSLLTSPSRQQKASENFRYILPGSNTTHILHAGTAGAQSGLGQSGKAFTALSSSGTIIGGQLTPSPTTASVETSPMDQDMSLGSSDDSSQGMSILSHRRQLSRELDTTEYIPLGRSHGRGRGSQRGGRGRGGRTPRGGRGRSQLWTSDGEFFAAAPGSGRKISTLADLRQIGAHVIEAGSETVDGVPVVSIPDYSTEGTGQSEILSAAQSIISENAAGTFGQGLTGFSDTATQLGLPDAEHENLAISESLSASQGPRVITQPIPSVRVNHGFDILTQGILGAANASRPPLRQRSLLTGATTTLHTASSLLSSLTEASASSLMSPVATVQQAEIDTLIQAAQAAAKPSITGSQAFAMSRDHKETSDSLGLTSQLVDGDFSPDLIKASDVENALGVNISKDIMGAIGRAQSHEEQDELDETVVSVDESQVSAAERYRMPVELFQPDEESPEKPIRLDDAASKLTADLPSKLFQESEMTPVDETAKSPYQHSRDGVHQALKEPKWSQVRMKEHPEFASSIDASMEVDLSAHGDSTSAFMEANRNEAPGEIDLRDSTNNITETSALGLLDEAVTGAQRATGEGKPGTVSLPIKSGRPRGRSKGRASKRGRKKSRIVSTSKLSDSVEVKSDMPAGSTASVVTPESSPDRNITHMITRPEMQSLQHSPSSSPTKHSKPNSTEVSFASDFILTKSDDDDKERRAEGNENLGYHAETVQQDAVLLFMKQTKAKRSIEREKFVVIKCSVSGPAFVCHKTERVNWDASSVTDAVSHLNSHFNYRVLSGKPVKSHHRHVSLGPREELFTSVPPPFSERRPQAGDELQACSLAVVIWRHPKLLQKPQSDPSKVPTVVPLVMEESCDPSCIGGSVVTSPDGVEMFAGIVVKQRQEMADWNTFVDREEAEEVIEDLTGEELKVAQRKYRNHLMTEMYIHAGDFSSHDDDNDDDFHEEDQDIKIEGKEEVSERLENTVVEKREEEELTEGVDNSTEEMASDLVNKVDSFVSVDSVKVPKAGSSKGRQKKRKHSSELAIPGQITKKIRSSQDEQSDSLIQSPSHSAGCSDIDSADTPSAAVSSRVNGTDAVSSPSHLCQATESGAATQPREAPTQQRFSSPSRRSSRTPIPSKKVLDAWGDYPVRSALKDKRTLSLSSDDELTGYSSGDMHQKKLKTKHAFSAS